MQRALRRIAARARPQGFPWKVFYRFVAVQFVLAIIGLSAAGLGARYYFKKQFLRQVRSQTQDSLKHFAVDLSSAPRSNWCEVRAAGTEMSLVLAKRDGSLICAFPADALGGKTVFDMPELQTAMRGEPGSRLEPQPSGVSVFHNAVSVGSGWVVRVSIPLTRLAQTIAVFDAALVVGLLLVGAVLLGLAYWSARRLVFPLGRLILKTQSAIGGNPEVTLREEFTEETFDEWLELESNIDTMRRDLAAKAQSLTMEQVELDTIMGAISDAILAVDPEGNPLFFNSRFEMLFGGEGLRRRMTKLWTIFREPEILESFTAALKEGSVAATKAIPLEQKGGLKNYFSISVSPLRRQDGTIYGAVGIFHDVTQLKSAEQMRIDFVANVSHELRTPLTSIKGYVDTLIEDAVRKKPVDDSFLGIISRNTERLLNLMNDLLDLSSIESDDLLQKDSVDTRDVTERVAKQLQSRMSQKKQNFAVEASAGSVVADPHRLEQVLTNLLDNAVKYTQEDGNIKVSWLSDGSDVLLKVWNDGPAIPIDHHPRLFERFYRVDKARSREQGGTGLGLAIVKHIMQRHEGSVWVESRVGQGTAFVCRFPTPTKTA